MKKILIGLIPLFAISSLTGCQDKAHSILAIKSIDDSFTFVELSVDQMKNLYESGTQFMVEFYTDYCGHCKDLEPLLTQYSQKNNNVIYRINLTSSEVNKEYSEKIGDKYPDILDIKYIPQIKYFNEKELTYDVDSNKFSSYDSLNKSLNKHFLSSTITMISSMSALKDYDSKNNNYLAYLYDLDDFKSIELSKNELIKKEIVKAKKNIVLINKSTFAHNFADLQAFYNHDITSFVVQKKGQQIKTIDYSKDDGSSLRELVSTL